ncbi:Uncharacterized protein Rs2_26533 [Raphanus sativus]|nr:Uncharacterized protein Rs2_26533 [Raphanus sativus]
MKTIKADHGINIWSYGDMKGWSWSLFVHEEPKPKESGPRPKPTQKPTSTDTSVNTLTCHDPRPDGHTCYTIIFNHRASPLLVYSGDHDRDPLVVANLRIRYQLKTTGELHRT